MFKASETQHFGERGAIPEPFGKRMVIIRNITQTELKDFVNADEPGKYYLDHFAKGAKRNQLSNLMLRNVVNAVPGMSFLVNTVTEAQNITRFFQRPEIKNDLFGVKLGTRLINEATRIVAPHAIVGSLTRILISQSYTGFRPYKLTKSLAQAAGLKITRTSIVPKQLKGSYKAYKVNKAVFKKL